MGRHIKRKRERKLAWHRERHYDTHHVPPKRHWKEGDILLRIKRNRHVAYHILVGTPKNKTDCAKRLLDVLDEFWP